MTQFSITAGANYFAAGGSSLNNRVGWSSVDAYGVYGTSTYTGGAPPLAEVYYNATDGTINLTVGVAGLTAFATIPFDGGVSSSYYYDASTAYTPGKIVGYETGPNNGLDFNGTTFYECIQGCTGQNPTSSPDYWVTVTPVLWSNHGRGLDQPGPANGYEPAGVYPDQQGYFDFGPPAYAAGTTYYAGAIVSYEGTNFECITTSTGNTPVPGEATTYWGLLGGVPILLGDNYFTVAYLEIQGTKFDSFVTQYGTAVTNANPIGQRLSAETDCGPGFVRYTWPCAPGLLTAGQTYSIVVG